MTLLNYIITSEYIFILMDTIALMGENKEPFIYTTKIYPLPHLDMVICGTGVSSFIIDWFVIVNSQMLVKDIDHLNEFAPQILVDTWKKFADDNRSTSTIYHFGYSNYESRYKCYVYRSTNGFTPEIQNAGTAHKPGVTNIESFIDEDGNLDLLGISFQQYRDDKTVILEKKVGIGGELISCLLQERNIYINKILSFIDYESMFTKMCERLEAEKMKRT
jgi:hypothetical protein